MRQADQEVAESSDGCGLDPFALSVGADEARRQVLASAALAGLIFLAAIASLLSGTA